MWTKNYYIIYVILFFNNDTSSARNYTKDGAKIGDTAVLYTFRTLTCACRLSSFFRVSSVVFDTVLHWSV